MSSFLRPALCDSCETPRNRLASDRNAVDGFCISTETVPNGIDLSTLLFQLLNCQQYLFLPNAKRVFTPVRKNDRGLCARAILMHNKTCCACNAVFCVIFFNLRFVKCKYRRFSLSLSLSLSVLVCGVVKRAPSPSHPHASKTNLHLSIADAWPVPHDVFHCISETA